MSVTPPLLRRVRSLRFSPHASILACLCVASFLAAAHVATNVGDRIPHFEDEFAFLFQAQTLASGRLVAPLPPEPNLFWIPFTVQNDGFWFGKYPIGYPLVMALGVLAGQPWLVNPSLAVACVAGVYFLGKRLYDRTTALVAAVLLVLSPLFVIQSASFLSHVAALGWTLLFTLLFIAARDHRDHWRAAGAGAVLGMLFLTRPFTAAAIAAPFVVWALGDLTLSRRRLAVYAFIAAGFLPFLALFLGYNQITTGNSLRTAYELYWPYDRVGFGPGFGVGDGHTLDLGILNTRYTVALARTYVFGWPDGLSFYPAFFATGIAVSTCILVMSSSIMKRGATAIAPQEDASPALHDLLLGSVVGALVLAHVAYWAPGTAYGPRYYFEAIGAFVLLSARGIVQLARGTDYLFASVLSVAKRGFAPGLPLALAIVGALFLFSYTRFVPGEFGSYLRWYDVDASGVRLVQAANLRHAVVLVAFDYWTDYAPFFIQNNMTFDGDVVYAIDRGDENARRALVARYPDRSFFRYAEGELRMIAKPDS